MQLLAVAAVLASSAGQDSDRHLPQFGRNQSVTSSLNPPLESIDEMSNP